MIGRCDGYFLALFVAFAVLSDASELSPTFLQVTGAGTANISLSTYNKTLNEDQAFTQLVTVNDSANFAIAINDIPDKVSFIIVQLHTQNHNMSMSYNKTSIKRTPGNFVIGSNIGLYVETTDIASVVVYASNENNYEVTSLIAVVAYTNDAPSPGGCNMEFDIKRSPFQKLVYDHATVTVDAQPSAIPNIENLEIPCEKYPLQHDAYRMYLPEQDFSNETYFLAITNMLTVKDIEKNADFIPASLNGSPMRRVFSVYPGTGSIHGMVARFANHSAAYVPIVTYGCDVSSWSHSCSMLTTTFSKVLCALTFFIGLFVTMRGQHYFKVSMFFVGLLFGGFIGYIVGTAIGSFTITGVLISAFIAGTITSLLWLILWMCYSSAIPSLMLSGLMLGTFFFCLFYFSIPVGLLYLEYNAYFGLIFATFLILAVLVFSVIPLAGNILCFTVLGAYATVLSIDYYSGASLKFILINVIRRCTVSNFNVAIIQPPYQDKDVLLTVFWSFLLIIGLYKQCVSNWNRAPFPPSTPNLVSENAPLLGGQRYRSRHRSFNSQRFRYDNSPELRF